MVEITRIPLSQIAPVGAGRIMHQREATLLVTAPGQWHYSAEAVFDLPGIDSGARIVNVRVEVESGRLGIGWLSADGSDWIVRSFITRTAAPTEVALTVPGGVAGGRLVIENATEGGQPAVAIIEGICVLETDDAAPPGSRNGNGTALIGSTDPARSPGLTDRSASHTTDEAQRRNAIKAAFSISHRHHVPSGVAIENFEKVFKLFDSPDEILKLVTPTPIVQNFAKNIWEFAHGKTTLTTYPWNISIPVADLCNARCTFCTSWLDGRKILDLDKLVLFEPVLRNALLIGLVGHGEPMAHPRFDELCDRLAEMCDPVSSVYTITNGFFLEKWRDQLERINLHSYSISLNAATAETHDVVMGLGRDAFPRIVESIEHILELSKRPGHDKHVFITLVVTQQNLHEIPGFIELGNRLGVSEIWLRSLLPQAGLIPGLNYHQVPPYMHPEFERLRRSAVAAIKASRVAVQADPGVWGQKIFSETLEQQILIKPPPTISREEALRDRDLRHRNEFLYHQDKGIFRGRPLDSGATSEVRWAGGRLAVLTPQGSGAYAASVPVRYPDEGPQEVRIDVEIACETGSLALGLLDEATNSWLDRVFVEPGPDRTVALQTSTSGQSLQLVIHNGGDGSAPARGSIGGVRIRVAGIGQSLPIEWELLTVHNAADPLDDGTNPLGREPRFACKAVYYNSYVNEFFYRVNPCCYLQAVPGYEEIRLDGDMTFMEAWNSPGMVELRRRLAEGPLFGACMRCPEKW
jgi:hypothetical protein